MALFLPTNTLQLAVYEANNSGFSQQANTGSYSKTISTHPV